MKASILIFVLLVAVVAIFRLTGMESMGPIVSLLGAFGLLMVIAFTFMLITGKKKRKDDSSFH
jgi:hypothetical protein